MSKWTASLLLAAGCAVTQSRPLASLPVAPCEIVSAPSARSVVVGAFADARGGEFGRERRLPFVGLFHRSAQLFYPESAGVLRGREGRDRFAVTGSLDGALPSLLAQTMTQMQLSPRVSVATQPNGADYFVTGRLRRSALRSDAVPIAAILGALFGVPFEKIRFDLEYEVAVFDSRAPAQPIFRRSYRSMDKRIRGLYYNHDAEFSLLEEGLRQTLPEAVRDIAQAISRAEAARDSHRL